MYSPGTRSPKILGLCAVVAAVTLGACTGPRPAEGPSDEDLRLALAETLVVSRDTLPADSQGGRIPHGERLLKSVYRDRDFSPIWVGPEGANERGRQLLAHLSTADLDALDPGRYDVDAILDPLAVGDADALASAEIYFSRALMRYAADLRGDDRRDATVVAAAGTATDFSGYLDSLIPREPAYRRLRAAMRLYRGIAEEGGWSPIPDGSILRQGVSDSRVIPLRRRLGATGDLPAPQARSNSLLFDEAVLAAVERFQQRHGLDADGIVGEGTLRTLNAPVDERIAKIADNLTQRRAGGMGFGERALIVNIAAQELILIEGGKEVLRSRTIVGQPDWRTPLLSSEVRSIEVNPTWTVPRKIALQEIVPMAAENGPDYLKARGYRLFDAMSREVDAAEIEWETLTNDYLPFILRQDAGPGNALGRVKFLFPNDEDIYLHDTPGRALFQKASRALSHGCVRVEKADELAIRLLHSGARWSKSDYERALSRGKTVRIRLNRPMPLYLVSFTAWVEENGVVQFRVDPYGMAEPGKNKSKPDNSA